MELEAVRRVPVRDLRLEIRWQVDDVDGAEWAFLDANSTSYAKPLGNEGYFGLRSHFNTELAGPDHRARLFAFLAAFLRLAFVVVDDGNPGEGGGVISFLALFQEERSSSYRVNLSDMVGSYCSQTIVMPLQQNSANRHKAPIVSASQSMQFFVWTNRSCSVLPILLNNSLGQAVNPTAKV